MIIEQLRVEILVYLRQPLYLLFSVLMPAVVFILISSTLGDMQYGNNSFFDQYIPAFVTLVLFAAAVYNIGNQVIGDKERGVYRRLLVTPVPFWRFMLVMVVKGALTAIVGLFVILICAKVVFDTPMPNLPAFLVGFLVALAYALAIGFGSGVVIQKLNTYSAIMMFTFLPMFFLSDAGFPLSQMPSWLQSVADFNPLFHLVKLMRWAWNPTAEVWQTQSLWISLMVLLGLLAVFLVVVWRRWRSNSR